MLKKIRRLLALQGMTLSAALWFAWKNRMAIERSVRAARAAWADPSGRRNGEVHDVAAVIVSDPDAVGRSGMAGTAGHTRVVAQEPTAVRLGY